MSISSIHSSAFSWTYEAPSFRSDPGVKTPGDLASPANPVVAKPVPSVQREPATANDHAGASSSRPPVTADPIGTGSNGGLQFHDPLQQSTSLHRAFGARDEGTAKHTKGPIHVGIMSTGRGSARLQLSLSKLPLRMLDPNEPNHANGLAGVGEQASDLTSTSSTSSSVRDKDQSGTSGASHTNGPGPAGPKSPDGASAKLQQSLDKLGLRLAGREKHAGNEIQAGSADLSAHADHHQGPQSIGTYTMTLPGISSYQKAAAVNTSVEIANASAPGSDWPGVQIDA